MEARNQPQQQEETHQGLLIISRKLVYQDLSASVIETQFFDQQGKPLKAIKRVYAKNNWAQTVGTLMAQEVLSQAKNQPRFSFVIWDVSESLKDLLSR